MASQLYRIKQGTGSTVRGMTYINLAQQLRSIYAQLQAEREAIIEAKDDANDYSTVMNVYGFVATDGTTPSESVAEASFLELDSMITNTSAAVLQFCARHLQ